MAISKVILNGETLMDVTSDTPSASNMLNGIIATKNDGTKVTGNITNKSSTDLTVSGATVTAPAGYYANAASKAVSTTTHPNPSASITSSTGVVTASHTQTTGYVTSGTTTSTMALTTQAAQTIYPSTADQTIASYRWLTGTQTIKSVTTSNLTAANIAEGVVVKVGDANNASRITQITGTHSGATSYTATISGSGNSNYCYVIYSGTKYYSDNGTFTFKVGDTLTIYCRGNNVAINGTTVSLSNYSYTYTLPVGDITINISFSSSTSNNIKIYGLVKPTGSLDIDNSGTYDVYGVSQVTVPAGSAFPPATTITINPAFSINSATGVVTASYSGRSTVTPTISSGYVTTGTGGYISTTGTSTYQLATRSAQTIYPSTVTQYIYSYRWLTGMQTIAGVTTTNLTASNIVEGVVVEVGDADNPSRITRKIGTYTPSEQYYKATLMNSGDTAWRTYIQYNNTTYYNSGSTFYFKAGGTITYHGESVTGSYVYSDGTQIYSTTATSWSYNYTAPAHPLNIMFSGGVRFNSPTISIDSNGIYDVTDYASAFVGVFGGGGDGFTADQIAMRLISGDISGNATSIRNHAFQYCSGLTTASFPLCTLIEENAFQYCSGLTMASFPSCTSIGPSAFQYCSSLTMVSFPLCTSIAGYAFYSCSSLTAASFPSCTTIGTRAFQFCIVLSSVSFPLCTTIGSYAFYDCDNLTEVNFSICKSIVAYTFYDCGGLTTINFPSCSSIGGSAFYRCNNLVATSFPICKTIGAYAFQSCSNLTTLSFPSCSMISNYAFAYCYNLLSLYLLGSSVATLSNVSVFHSTPISSYTAFTNGVYGSIFVPASLYDSYITATNWLVYSSRIVSM